MSYGAGGKGDPAAPSASLSIFVISLIASTMLWSMYTIYNALASPQRLWDPFELSRMGMHISHDSRFWHDHDRVTVRHLPPEATTQHEEHSHKGPISYSALNHVTVVVDDLEAAMSFYTQAMGFHPAYGFSHVRNGGEAKAAGVEADAALRVLHVPGIGLSIELLQLSGEHEHSVGKSKAQRAAVAAHLWQAGAGIGHLSLKVKDVRAAYSHLRRWEGKGVIMLAHGPVHLDTADFNAVQLYREPERDSARRKAEMAFRMARRSALFFRDPYGVTWALDQHD